MSTIKPLWLWGSAGMAFAIFLGTAIFYSAQPSNKDPLLTSNPLSQQPEHIETGSSPTDPVAGKTNSSTSDLATYPAPGRKLHKLINEDDLQPAANLDLDQRMQSLDQQLASINKQLKAQGIAVSEATDKRSVQTTDTERRLQAIREHMANKIP